MNTDEKIIRNSLIFEKLDIQGKIKFFIWNNNVFNTSVEEENSINETHSKIYGSIFLNPNLEILVAHIDESKQVKFLKELYIYESDSQYVLNLMFKCIYDKSCEEISDMNWFSLKNEVYSIDSFRIGKLKANDYYKYMRLQDIIDSVTKWKKYPEVLGEDYINGRITYKKLIANASLYDEVADYCKTLK